MKRMLFLLLAVLLCFSCKEVIEENKLIEGDETRNLVLTPAKIEFSSQAAKQFVILEDIDDRIISGKRSEITLKMESWCFEKISFNGSSNVISFAGRAKEVEYIKEQYHLEYDMSNSLSSPEEIKHDWFIITKQADGFYLEVKENTTKEARSVKIRIVSHIPGAVWFEFTQAAGK